jgi:hypothetical protein
MEGLDFYSILLDTVTNDRRHADYERVTALACYYRMLITGKGIEAELKQFNPREDKVMFEQRCNLTIPVTPAAVSSLKKPFAKVPRTQPVTRKITAKNENDSTSVAEIQERIKSFYGGDNNVGGLDYYLQNRFVDMSFEDPNAWVVIEFDAFDPNTEKATPRPFEVTAEEAINFSLVNNVVEWLIVQTSITYVETVDGKDVEKAGKKFTIYGDNEAYTLTQVAEKVSSTYAVSDGEEVINLEEKGVFVKAAFATITGKVPAFRVGYIFDLETAGRTFVNPFHDALCFFQKSIKLGSEFDISTCLHTFPQKLIRVTTGCPGENGMSCIRGKLMDGTACNTCKGTGRPLHTSGQDVIEVELPEPGENAPTPLSDYVYYVPLPIDLLKLQKEWLDNLTVDCHQAVFNSSVLLRKTDAGQNIDATATEKDHDMESVYDTLAPFGEKVSSVWQTVVELIAILTDNQDKVTIIHRFPSNFKLKTRQDLYLERKALQDSGAPAFAIEAVDDELAEDIYADDAEELLKYLVKKSHAPFKGKTTDEVTALLASTFVLKKTKILYGYFDTIFTELENEYLKAGADFYLEKPEIRQQKIDAKVQEILDALDAENKTAFGFNSPFNAPAPAGDPNAQN